MKLSLQDLRFYQFSGNGVPKGYENIYDETYRMWRQVWEQAFTELNKSQPLYSDGFTRQTRVGAIFHKDQCIAMCSTRELDLSVKVQRHDSLLSSWDDEAFELLTVDGPRVAVGSYLSVSPDFRGEIAPDLTLKLLMLWLTTHLMLDSDCDVMTGTMRCNRGTDRAAYRAGARFLKKSNMYGVEVDLVGFFRQEILQKYDEVTHLWSETLWKNRVDLLSSKSVVRTQKKVA